MIIHSFKEAFRLIMRSKTECLVYLFAFVLSEVLVLAACGWAGIDYPLRSSSPGVPEILRLAAFSAPALLITTWFGAGLVGRISMDAFKGSPDSLVSYANGWFFRNLAGTLVISAAAFLPAFVFMALPKTLAAAGMLVWFLVFIWLAIRVSMWTNIMFMEEVGPIAAMSRSYSVSEGYVVPLALLSLPLFVRVGWEIILPDFPAGSIALINALKNLLIGLATLVQVSAMATVYLTIKHGNSAGNNSQVERLNK